ncbi:MAG: alpha-glucan family phosphorylase [Nitrososphaerota archaeon]|nr:alpha-glucan family phosphorylase [Nitrososphaerota archaeon]
MIEARNGLDFISLPENLESLRILAGNTYWTWDRRVRRVFERIGNEQWKRTYNPVQLIQELSTTKLEELSRDENFLTDLSIAYTAQKKYMAANAESWFVKTYGTRNNNLVAYFSAEYGLASCLRTYSGGLGVLSGDHLKAASDLGIPLVGIGLFYRRGYFSQSLNHDGWQVESYPENEPYSLPVEPVLHMDSSEPLVISVPLADRQVAVRAWRISVGRVFLYLLDTNIRTSNSPADCDITSELYGGDSELRIKQEIVLGMGGVKLLNALGLKPTIFHMNEGHSAFAGLERIGSMLEDNPGLSFHEALDRVRSTNLFTTHTPVAAGIDVFSREQIEHYLGFLPQNFHVSMNDVFALGQESSSSNSFNMAVLAIRLSRDVSAVSKLHKEVAKKLWNNVLQEESFDLDEKSSGEFKEIKKMDSVTNGIHILSWVSDSMADVYDQYLGAGWEDNVHNLETWRKVTDIPEGLLWEIRCRERARLVDFLRGRPAQSEAQALDTRALTVGFARRFATYKRATLLFADGSRLEKLLNDKERPIQFVFAGKAHPRDNDGKRLIQEIHNFSKRHSVAGKLVFLEDYDMSTAKKLVQGVDLWLNNPRRPLEASGTSGMKVLANGGLNFSVLDGWWDEAYSQSSGWAIGSGIDVGHPYEQDKMDSDSLYNILENQIIPDFYDRTEGLPLRWLRKMKHSMRTLTPIFSTRRMVMEYSQRFYFRKTGESTA